MIEHLEKRSFQCILWLHFFFFFKLSYILGSRVQASAQIIMSENLHLAHDEGDKMMGIGKEKIESFIKKRGDIIERNGKSNEEAAKQSLILPMLRELGYATDALEVYPEYATNEQYYSNKGAKCCVDYAIFLDGSVTPSIIIEAKALSEKLDGHVAQLASYYRDCKGLELGILTNGSEYRLFKTSDEDGCNMDCNPILSFTIDELLYNADKLTLFWKYASKETNILRLKSSVDSVATVFKETSERNALISAVESVLKADKEHLDSDFIKYLVAKAGIEVSKWYDKTYSIYRPKVKEAIERSIKKMQTEYLSLVENSRANNVENSDSGKQQDADNAESSGTCKQCEKSAEKEPVEGGGDSKSRVETTELELQIVDKVQAMIDASDLPKKLWSKELNDWMPVEVKYKDTVNYMGMFIHHLSSEELVSRRSPRSWAIRYGGQYDIEKGCIGFNCDIDDRELRTRIPKEFEVLSEQGPYSYVADCRVLIRSFEDLEKLKPAILYCFKNNIDAFIENNPQPN